MNRFKKLSDHAFADLRDYLRNDRDACDMLAAVNRYIGELRRINSTLKDELEREQSANKTLREKFDNDTTAITTLQGQLAEERSRVRQSEAAVALERQRFENLERQLNPESSGDSGLDSTQWWATFKALRKRLPIPPMPARSFGEVSDRIYVFDLIDFGKPSLDSFATIGMLATIAATSIVKTVGFSFDQNIPIGERANKDWHKLAEKRLAAFFGWCGASWIHFPDWHMKILHESPPNVPLPESFKGQNYFPKQLTTKLDEANYHANQQNQTHQQHGDRGHGAG